MTKQAVRDQGAKAKAEIDAVLAALDTPGVSDDIKAVMGLINQSDVIGFYLTLGKLYG